MSRHSGIRRCKLLWNWLHHRSLTVKSSCAKPTARWIYLCCLHLSAIWITACWSLEDDSAGWSMLALQTAGTISVQDSTTDTMQSSVITIPGSDLKSKSCATRLQVLGSQCIRCPFSRVAMRKIASVTKQKTRSFSYQGAIYPARTASNCLPTSRVLFQRLRWTTSGSPVGKEWSVNWSKPMRLQEIRSDSLFGYGL